MAACGAPQRHRVAPGRTVTSLSLELQSGVVLDNFLTLSRCRSFCSNVRSQNSALLPHSNFLPNGTFQLLSTCNSDSHKWSQFEVLSHLNRWSLQKSRVHVASTVSTCSAFSADVFSAEPSFGSREPSLALAARTPNSVLIEPLWRFRSCFSDRFSSRSSSLPRHDSFKPSTTGDDLSLGDSQSPILEPVPRKRDSTMLMSQPTTNRPAMPPMSPKWISRFPRRPQQESFDLQRAPHCLLLPDQLWIGIRRGRRRIIPCFGAIVIIGLLVTSQRIQGTARPTIQIEL